MVLADFYKEILPPENKQPIDALQLERRGACIFFDSEKRVKLSVSDPRHNSMHIARDADIHGSGYIQAQDSEIDTLIQAGYQLPDWRELTIVDLIHQYPDWKPK